MKKIHFHWRIVKISW